MQNMVTLHAQTTSRHILGSEIYWTEKNQCTGINVIRITAKSTAIFPDYLYLFWLTDIKPKRSKINLSNSQKKYLTLTISNSLLNLKLSKTQFNIFFSLLFHQIFRDYLKHPTDNVLTLQKEIIQLNLVSLPVVLFNRSLSFKILFYRNDDLNLKLQLKFNVISFTQKIFYLRFFRFIVNANLKYLINSK